VNTPDPVAPASLPAEKPAGSRRHTTGLPLLWISALVLVLDQITKWLVVQGLEYGEAIPFTSFFNLVRAHNTGAAFSLFADHSGWQRGFFITVAAVASVVILHLLRQPRGHRVYYIALALILGGAIGNVIDRLAYGYVVDFLDFYLGGWHWPAFNVADSAITVGAGLLIWDGLRGQPHKQPEGGT